jgi:Tfp pilus assembly protein FimV
VRNPPFLGPTGLLLVLGLVAPLVAACVPVPVARSSAIVPCPSLAVAPTPTEAPTPVPTPTGPTPIPSFIRPTLTPEPSFFVYVVVRGDTLSTIARRFETTTQSLAFWNRATYPSLDPDSATYAPDRIKVGWRLRLHPGVEVDPEDLLGPSLSLPAGTSAPPSPS